jgi:hypothetical protein
MTNSPKPKNSWAKRHRFHVQVAALAAGVLAPFLLFAALQAGIAWLAAASFVIFALAMAAAGWMG